MTRASDAPERRPDDWQPDWPTPASLRRDTERMTGSIGRALLDVFGDDVVGVYFTGSASKPWASAID